VFHFHRYQVTPRSVFHNLEEVSPSWLSVRLSKIALGLGLFSPSLLATHALKLQQFDNKLLHYLFEDKFVGGTSGKEHFLSLQSVSVDDLGCQLGWYFEYL
jgi:hypothetical protein